MNQQASLYRYISLAKLILWIIILVIDYSAINVFEDPIVAIGIALVWCFLLFRWASFFFFLLMQKLFQNQNSTSIPEADSYKISFLFGMYALLNIICIFLWKWNKILALILLILFIGLLYLLLVDNSKHGKKSK